MTPVVVDASVSLRWAFEDEDGVAQAVALRDDALSGRFTMVAPSLWAYEVTNGVTSAVRRHRVTRRTGAKVVEDLFALGVGLVDPEPQDVYRIALRFGLSAYDGAYVALAAALGVRLWSGDRALCRAVGGDRGARWIGDYESGASAEDRG